MNSRSSRAFSCRYSTISVIMKVNAVHQGQRSRRKFFSSSSAFCSNSSAQILSCSRAASVRTRNISRRYRAAKRLKISGFTIRPMHTEEPRLNVHSPDIMSRDRGNYCHSWQSTRFWRLSVRDNHAPSCVSRVGSYDIDTVSPSLPHPALLWCGLQARNVEEFNILDAERDHRRKEGRIVLVLVKVRRLSAGLIDPDSGRVDGD